MTARRELPNQQPRLVVNLIAEKSRDTIGTRLVDRLMREVSDYYRMGQVHIDELRTYFFYGEGAKEFCIWLGEHRQIQVRPFTFRSHNHILAHGFEFVHDAHLTKYILALEESQ